MINLMMGMKIFIILTQITIRILINLSNCLNRENCFKSDSHSLQLNKNKTSDLGFDFDA